MAVTVLSMVVFHRGHKAEYTSGVLRYIDTGEEVNEKRPCPQCGNPPTEEGYDACIGHIPGAQSVCCGHGVERGYVLWDDMMGARTSQVIIDEIRDSLDLLQEIIEPNE